ncbi:hypothetical protein [Candidatus Ichthyocystis sparus]|uniref:hypothetical protein n=1 Tax=Candidatus Ichthyocystis sparus TaxID=1561004 RepID=UPI000B81A783|nr:hypothetical protein [Candidatus Ichthyocystis sparus]
MLVGNGCVVISPNALDLIVEEEEEEVSAETIMLSPQPPGAIPVNKEILADKNHAAADSNCAVVSENSIPEGRGRNCYFGYCCLVYLTVTLYAFVIAVIIHPFCYGKDSKLPECGRVIFGSVLSALLFLFLVQIGLRIPGGGERKKLEG